MMTDTTDIPLSLMRMALALLDRNSEGASSTACHLQAAIDARVGAKPMQDSRGQEIDRQ